MLIRISLSFFMFFIALDSLGADGFSEEDLARELMMLEQESCDISNITALCFYQPIDHQLTKQKSSYSDFLHLFINSFYNRRIEVNELENFIHGNDDIFTNLYDLWTKLFNQSNCKSSHHQNEKIKLLSQLSKERNLPFTIRTPIIIRWLLKEFTANEFIAKWENSIIDHKPLDQSQAQKIFFREYKTNAARIDFSFNLLFFLTFSTEKRSKDDAIKTLLAEHPLLSNLILIENRPVTMIPLMIDMEQDLELHFSDEQSLFNFPAHTADFVKPLKSLKIANYSHGIWGLGQWPRELLERFLTAIKKSGMRNPDLNRIHFNLPVEGIKLTLAEWRLLNNQDYLGTQKGREEIFDQILSKFRTIQGFKNYLRIADSWLDEIPMLKNNNNFSLAEALFTYIVETKGIAREEYITALNLDIGKNKQYHRELFDRLVAQKGEEDHLRLKRQKLLEKTALTQDELGVLGKIDGILIVPEKPSQKKAPKKRSALGKKNKGGQKKKQPQQRQNDPIPLVRQTPAPQRRTAPRRAQPVSQEISRETLGEIYPDLSTEGQELFTAVPALLPTDSELYKSAIEHILNFRKKHTPSQTSGKKEKTTIELPSDFFDTSALQHDIMQLDYLSPGYAVILNKLADTQELFDKNIGYRTSIRDLLRKMAFDNFVARIYYFHAYYGFLSLHFMCHEFLRYHAAQTGMNRADREIRERILGETWNDFMGLEGVYLKPAEAQRAFLNQFLLANLRAKEIVNLINNSTVEIAPDYVNELHQEARIFDDNLSSQAQREITGETFEIEQKMASMQAIVGILYQFFPEVFPNTFR